MSREDAIQRYIVLRLLAEDIRRLCFLVEGLYQGAIQLPSSAPFTRADLKDTVRTAFFGWFAKLIDKDPRAVYAFDLLLLLFPGKRPQIIKVQAECEACESVLQQFRSNVAFHSGAELRAHVKARRDLTQEDTFLDLESARQDFLHLMAELISGELTAIPELPNIIARLGISYHPAFANAVSTQKGA
jgi:hypothetical protein